MDKPKIGLATEFMREEVRKAALASANQDYKSRKEFEASPLSIQSNPIWALLENLRLVR